MQRKIYFQNNHGQKLCGLLDNPNGKNDLNVQDNSNGQDNLNRSEVKLPIIILCHGFRSSKDSSNNLNTQKALNEAGFAVFRFDFFGHGESEGKFGTVTVTELVDDVCSAIEYVKKMGFEKIGLMGSSMGGLAALIASAQLQTVQALALKAPVIHFIEKELMTKTEQELMNWKREGYTYYQSRDGKTWKLKYMFWEDAEKYNGYEIGKRIQAPILIVHGNQDTQVPLAQSQKFAHEMPNVTLKIIPSADHVFSSPKHFKEATDEIVKFMEEHLKTNVQ